MDFIKFYLIFWWIMLLIYKHELHIKFYNKFKYKFIDKLTSCEYCMETHIATFLGLLYAFLIMNPYVAIYGIMASALSNILKK